MKKERIHLILEELARNGALSTREAEKLYGASAATIRRDFNELAAAGVAIRTHGGVAPLPEAESLSIPFALREEWNAEEKKKMAKRAVEFIGKEDSVMIYGGSSTAYLGLYLKSGTIITNLPDLCRMLRLRFPSGGGPHLILTGGELNYLAGHLEGPALRRSLENYEADIGIASAYGFDETGLVDVNDECSELISLMLGKSALRIVLADHTKFKRRSYCRCLNWEKIHILITTFAPENHHLLNAARAKGVKVVFAT